MDRLKLYTSFHLNLAYSSIEEEQRPLVIRACYWPLLRLAKKFDLPLGIEAPAFTLQAAASIDPEWLLELRRLLTEGRCEFIGSGYGQVIGPLVPAEVNAANLRIGNQIYEKLLGRRPQIALLNEQAYSSGLIQHYAEAGFKAIMMDWDNPASAHPEWNPQFRYLPQKACDQYGTAIHLIWTNSIAFQKFQRYAHGELNLDEYICYLSSHIGDETRAFPLYCNDIEIFNFRPGRYETEANLQEDEWLRIEHLFEALLDDERFAFVSPSQVLDFMNHPGASNDLRLEASGQPVPVKKQNKYNLIRWAVTGRNDLAINTCCWMIYKSLMSRPRINEEDWKELCYLWSSDFRTHITEKRWIAYLRRLAAILNKIKDNPDLPFIPSEIHPINPSCSSGIVHRLNCRDIEVDTAGLKARINLFKGLSIESLLFKSVSEKPLMGTLHHGYYDDINWGADYYTGHLIFELPGRPKITDLSPIEPAIENTIEGISISGKVNTPLGPINKRIVISREMPELYLEYRLDWETMPAGSLRLGNITLNPLAFDRATLFYRTNNGGFSPETFSIGNVELDHGKAVSFLVSATTGIGMTDGFVEIGDAHKCIRIEVDRSKSAPLGLIICKDIGDTYFCRLALSLMELDETCRVRGKAEDTLDFQMTLIAKISAKAV